MMLLPRSLLIAVALTLAVGQRAVAQSLARLGMAAGLTKPVSTYGEDKDIGYHVGLLLDVRVPASPLGFRAEGFFHELKYAGNSTKEQIWALTANMLVKIPTGTIIFPYAIGGVGIYNSRRDLFFRASSNTDPGVNLGGGLRLELGDVATFVEARYHKASGDAGIRLMPVTIGILF
jgi:hypothetical protein